MSVVPRLTEQRFWCEQCDYQFRQKVLWPTMAVCPACNSSEHVRGAFMRIANQQATNDKE
jgi:Zn finger protein HypA/HybF involved in hydrogenase expression